MVFIHDSAAGSRRKRSVASPSSSAPDASLVAAGILDDILKSLGDNKKYMRECALNTLDLWLAAVHLDKMFLLMFLLLLLLLLLLYLLWFLLQQEKWIWRMIILFISSERQQNGNWELGKIQSTSEEEACVSLSNGN
ncbi:hypothetical protein S83_062725, partial [Arachis hypogaea]